MAAYHRPMALRLALIGAVVCSEVAAASPRLRQLRAGAMALQVQDQQLGIHMPRDTLDFTVAGSAPLTPFDVSSEAEGSMTSAAESGIASLMVSIDVHSGKLSLQRANPKDSQTGLVPVAWASFNNSYQRTGWAYLSVNATEDPRISNDIKMYAAGVLEGAASTRQIRDFKHNADILMAHDEERHHALAIIHDMFDKSVHAICTQSNMTAGANLLDGSAPTDPWWKHARYALLQSWGVLDGFNRRIGNIKGKQMSMVEMLVLNSDGETPELEMAYDMEESLLRQSQRDPDADDDSDAANASSAQALIQRKGEHHRVYHALELHSRKSARRARRARRAGEMKHMDDRTWRRIKESSGRCSALVRLTTGNRDLMVGHTTFSDFSEMNRIFKYYDIPLGSDSVRRMGFSSYPGVVGSTDDYYVLDSGLVVTETTISMLTDEPYDKLTDNVTALPDFMRIMMANRLAKTAPGWADLMKKSATGTYSSQWMVVDYKQFTPGQAVPNGTLVVIEQIPGLSHAEDMSARLQKTGFWASENRAWFKDVRDSIGATEAQDMHGDLFSADRNPRATIFAGTAPKVQTLADMRGEMRRNRWPHEIDGGEGNTPDHAIAARGDLDKSSPNPNGAVDAKVTNRCLVRKLQCNAISGPTAATQKPFKWTDDSGKELYPGMPHQGQPDFWNFDWVRMTPNGEASQSLDECVE
jgi:hypothetical protein